jgi:hypothetical protein
LNFWVFSLCFFKTFSLDTTILRAHSFTFQIHLTRNAKFAAEEKVEVKVALGDAMRTSGGSRTLERGKRVDF